MEKTIIHEINFCIVVLTFLTLFLFHFKEFQIWTDICFSIGVNLEVNGNVGFQKNGMIYFTAPRRTAWTAVIIEFAPARAAAA